MSNLRDQLENNFTVEDMKNIGRLLGLKGLSSLRKADLAARLADYFLDPENMKNRLAVLTDWEIRVFERAAKRTLHPEEGPVYDAAQKINHLHYGFFTAEDDDLEIPSDVAETYQTINTPEFAKYRKKISWLYEVLECSGVLYGLAPFDLIYQIYTSRSHFQRISQDEVRDMIANLPQDMTEYRLQEEMVVDISLLPDEAFKRLANRQGKIQAFIPSWQQVEDYARNGYFADEFVYKKLMNCLEKQYHMSYEKANNIMRELYHKIYDENNTQSIFQWLCSSIGTLNRQEQEKIREMFNDTINGTRMRIYRGNTLNDLKYAQNRR